MAYENIFAALGDPTRKAIFDRLRLGSQTVIGLARTLPVSRPAVSQHLKILKQAGLVADRADGARRRYYIAQQGLAGARAYLQAVWEEAEAAYAAEVVRQLEERRFG